MFWQEFDLLSPGSSSETPCVRGVAWGLRLQPELCEGAGVGRGMELPALVPAQGWPGSTHSPCAGTMRVGAEESCLWPPARQEDSLGCRGLG